MRPYDVTDTDQFLTMESDNFPGDPARWAILHNGGHVTLFAPADDMGSTMFSIPREEFNAIVDWYLKDQKTTPADPDARFRPPGHFGDEFDRAPQP